MTIIRRLFFKDADGHVQGVFVDQWRLWEKKTGIHVEIHAMDWNEALRRMKAGEFDVLDTAFETDERRGWAGFHQTFHENRSANFLSEGHFGNR